jgi:periplasmic protein TonB
VREAAIRNPVRKTQGYLCAYWREENTMFDELLESTLVKKDANKSWTVVLSTLVQTLILGVLILMPLMHTEALPKTMLSIDLVAPLPPPAPPAQPAKAAVRPGVRLIQLGILHEPIAIPKNVVLFKEPEIPPDVTNNPSMNGIFTNIPGQGMVGSNNPAPPAPPKPIAPTRIKQGGVVTAASILSQTRPLYSTLARMAHIQGNVVLHAIIGKDGRVAQLEVLSGHPLLVQSALDAVKQWVYKPTLLNGDPVEVDTTITVTFTMGG